MKHTQSRRSMFKTVQKGISKSLQNLSVQHAIDQQIKAVKTVVKAFLRTNEGKEAIKKAVEAYLEERS